MAERDFLELDAESKEKHWWWSVKVGKMSLKAPITVTPEVPCEQAVAIMRENGFDQLPVVDQNG